LHLLPIEKINLGPGPYNGKMLNCSTSLPFMTSLAVVSTSNPMPAASTQFTHDSLLAAYHATVMFFITMRHWPLTLWSRFLSMASGCRG